MATVAPSVSSAVPRYTPSQWVLARATSRRVRPSGATSTQSCADHLSPFFSLFQRLKMLYLISKNLSQKLSGLCKVFKFDPGLKTLGKFR